MPFFSKVFRSNKDGSGGTSKSKKHALQNGAVQLPPPKPRWDDAWLRKDVEPEEVQELLRGCTQELKSKALDMPFLLLPFRPASDPSAARSFIRSYFDADKELQFRGEGLEQELRLTEPMVLCSIMKWCWSRLAGGVVTWEAYELFRIGEQDSDMARDAFATFIPISVESDARTKIIFDFFDLMAAIAAHGKNNGMAGRQLSRLAGWWAFEQVDTGNGFDGGYKSWTRAADATSHLFFAYLRSLSPDSVQGINGISALPLSLQNLVQATEYPPEQPNLTAISKVVMIVDSVSPTPFALLRRAKHFEYREDDQALHEFSNYEDPVQALTDECRRVLKSISSTNQSAASNSKASTSLRDASWSRFEDIGFGGLGDDSDNEDTSALGNKRNGPHGLRSAPQSKTHDFGRPTTPSWADFLSAGFVDEPGKDHPALLSLPHDKMLPPIDTRRGQSSQSHRRPQNDIEDLEPGELASINLVHFDDTFWWVWISSLAGEEPTERKGVFGRCALIETNIRGGKWLVLEEMVKGAAPEPEMGAYIVEKKSRFGFTKKGRLTRTKPTSKKASPTPKPEPYLRSNQQSPTSKTGIGNDQHARIQAAAAVLQQKHRDQNSIDRKRGRVGDAASTKTNSVFTLQPVIMSEAAPAMKWANSYDKNAVRAAYLGADFTGRGQPTNFGSNGLSNISSTNGSITPVARKEHLQKTESYGFPRQDSAGKENLPPLPNKPEPPLPPEPETQPRHVQQTPSPPPAPLPAVPFKDLHPTNRAVVEAAQVPLPAATPWEQPRPVEVPLPAVTPLEQPRLYEEPTTTPSQLPLETDGKPLPPVEPAQTMSEPMPALSREHTEQPNGVSSTTSSPEANKSAKKLKKSQNSGLKGFFGRNKSTPVVPAPSRPADSTAVAAARAAYEGPQVKPNYVAPQPPKLARRLSGMGRKKVPPPIPVDAYASTQGFNGPIGRSSEPSPLEPPRQFYANYGSKASVDRIDSSEQRHPHREFQSFDQDPTTDHPAYAPEAEHEGRSGSATPRQYEPEPKQRQYEQEPTQRLPEQEPIEEPYESQPVQRQYQHDDISEVSEEDRPSTPPHDRWAQIRKNAAERVAKQGQNRENTDETEEETSGEETIESRVARIKARVAELTGNMDGART